MKTSELIRVYQCLGDETRLRILNLLTDGPLCVCHFQRILGVTQVKASRHLAFLRKAGCVEVVRHATWRIYRIPKHPSAILERHLACLRDCADEVPQLKRDLEKRRKMTGELATVSPLCCPSPVPAG